LQLQCIAETMVRRDYPSARFRCPESGTLTAHIPNIIATSSIGSL
jgi:hypothetical protein